MSFDVDCNPRVDANCDACDGSIDEDDALYCGACYLGVEKERTKTAFGDVALLWNEIARDMARVPLDPDILPGRLRRLADLVESGNTVLPFAVQQKRVA